MKYIKLKNGDSFSAMTLGAGKLGSLASPEAVQLIKTAKKHGVDCLDMNAEKAQAFVNVHDAIDGSVSDWKLIIHFGVDYSKGEVRRVTKMEEVMNSVTAQMQTLRIDRLDYACLDCLSGLDAMEAAKTCGILPMMQELKNAKVIHEICAYTETPDQAEALLGTGIFAFVIVKSDLGTIICEEAGKAVSEIKSPADLVELHSMLKEYKV